MKTNTTLARLFLIIVLIASVNELKAQKQLFIGIQPGLTKETFYEKNEFDINVIPIVLQTSLSKRMDIRAVTLANYHFGPSSQFSDLGVNVIAPIYFKKKENVSDISSGFYLGPMLGMSKNLVNKHNTLNTAAELGYLFPTEKSFTLMMGIQMGASYFAYENQENIWRNHFGFKINLGFWL